MIPAAPSAQAPATESASAKPPPPATAPSPAGLHRGWARDTALVARFELGEALRTRLLIVMLFLFVGSGSLAAWGFSEVVDGVEQRAAQVTGAPTTRRPGGALRRMRESKSYRDMLRAFMRDDAKAAYFAEKPPTVVFFGWAALMFTPWLILFTAADTIASEVSSRGIRYTAMRTSRLAYALGKAVGQAVIVAGVTALAALAFYLVTWIFLDGFEHAATAAGLLSFWPRVVVYGLPFVGWAMLASMATSSTNVARILSLGGAVGLAILNGLAGSPYIRGESPWSQAAWDLVTYLTPFGHREGLIYPPGGAFATDVALCLALAVIYFSAGFAILRRRDL